jgi:Tautomerase enzyme
LHASIWLKERPRNIAPLSLTSFIKGLSVSSRPPDGDRFIVVNEHKPENLIYDPTFLGMQRSPDFMLIQVTSTVGNTKDQKLAFYRQIADELKSKLGVRPDDITINMVFVKQEDWSFGRGEPWN